MLARLPNIVFMFEGCQYIYTTDTVDNNSCDLYRRSDERNNLELISYPLISLYRCYQVSMDPLFL